MLKRDYPIYFDLVELAIDRNQWDASYSNLVVINTTEDGRDDVEILRSGKVTISAQFNCTPRWAGFFVQYNSLPSISVKYYDVYSKNYVTRSMRMENLTVDEVQNSDTVEGTEGLYIVGFNLVEF